MVMETFLERIHRANPRINAICTLRPDEELIAAARECDDSAPKGPLHGIPIAIKDLVLTKGIRTTFDIVTS